MNLSDNHLSFFIQKSSPFIPHKMSTENRKTKREDKEAYENIPGYSLTNFRSPLCTKKIIIISMKERKYENLNDSHGRST